MVHDTQSLISYTALSYAWGAPQYTEVLTIDNCAYPITPNLAAALRCLRDLRQYRMLWVDAVCINQHDDDEKSAQVKVMLSIFQKAEDVQAWLGPSTAEIAFMFDVVENFHRHQEHLSTLKNHGHDCVDKLVIVEHGLRDIFSRAWFRRTWIRQEVFGARQITALCGTHCRPWHLLSKMWNYLHIVQEKLMNRGGYLIKQNAGFPVLLQHMKSTEETPPALGLFQTLTTSAQFQESDPKDKVYATLGMTSTSTRNSVTPDLMGSSKLVVDYRRTVSEVYQDVTKYLINRH